MDEVGNMKINTLYNQNCLDTMRSMPDAFVDLVVTSPPYDNMRIYDGYSFEFEAVAAGLSRVIKPGGVCVWVVNDSTENGSESGTSFRQALYFKQIGFGLETMIWEKTGSGALGSNRLYAQNFEYMFVLFKGRPTHTNLIMDRENKVKAGKVKVNGAIGPDGKGTDRIIERKPFGKRTNIWRIDPQKNTDHPAPFPLQLVTDHILTWSGPQDIVYDPFMGSGTTAVAAIQTGRQWLGSELSSAYCQMARDRINAEIQKSKSPQ